MAKTFSLNARFSLNTEPFSKSLKGIQRQLKVFDRTLGNSLRQASGMLSTLGKPFAALSGIGALSLGAAVQQFVTLGDSIDKAAIRAGVTTGALQRLRVAAMLSGMGAEQMDKALSKLTYQLGQAATGKNDNLVQMFRQLGVEWKDSNGQARNAAEVMRELADAVQANEDPAKRASMLTQIFGDDLAAYLVPALKDGAAGLDAMAKQAEDLGLVLSEDEVKNAAALGDKFGLFNKVVGNLFYSLAGRLAPVLMNVIDKIQAIVIANKEIISLRVQEAVESIARAIDKIDFAAIGSGIAKTLGWVSKAIDAVGGLGNVLKFVAGFFAVRAAYSVVSFGATLFALGKAIAGIVLAIGGLPVAIGAAVVAAGTAIWYFWDDIKSWFSGFTDRLKTFITKYPMLSATAVGPFLAVIASLNDSLFGSITGWIDTMKEKISVMVSTVWAEVKKLWEQITGFFGGLLDTVIKSVVDSAKGLGKQLRKSIDAALSWLPDWMKSPFGGDEKDGGASTAVQPAAVPAPRQPLVPLSGAAGMQGSIAVQVMLAQGLTASVDKIDAKNGALGVDLVGGMNFVGTD